MIRETFDYVDYLDLKKSIDDYSLNPQVWKVMADWVSKRQQNGQTLRILEIGAGIGTMIERLLDNGLLYYCDYTAVELEPGFRDAAMQRLQLWAGSNSSRFVQHNISTWSISQANKKIVINWIQGDAMQTGQQFGAGSFDLIIGHAVVDLLPVPICIPGLLALLSEDGACYFSLNYAGDTQFLPSVTGDAKIFQLYNDDMDKRFPELEWQPSHTGHLLGPWLISHGLHVLAEGDSDWVLQAKPDLPGNLFIANIIDTIETALGDLPGLHAWLETRRQQLQAGQLQFRASNRDCFGLKGRH